MIDNLFAVTADLSTGNLIVIAILVGGGIAGFAVVKFQQAQLTIRQNSHSKKIDRGAEIQNETAIELARSSVILDGLSKVQDHHGQRIERLEDK